MIHQLKGQKVKGHIIEDGQFTANTIQCVHCGAHWMVERGSGKERGFCMKCLGPTCGKPECLNCLPFENWLEMQEQGHTDLKIGSGVLRKVRIGERL